MVYLPFFMPFFSVKGVIYDLNALKIRVYLFNDFAQSVEIDLMQELQKGNHKTMIADLFPKESLGYKHYVKYNDAEYPTLAIEELISKQKYTESNLEQMDVGGDIVSLGYEWLKNKKNPKTASKFFCYGITLLPKNVDLSDSLGKSYIERGTGIMPFSVIRLYYPLILAMQMRLKYC
ncbi:hypothetical protein [Myroides odoratus]|uniref:hypothetical protein n=1 Tax=Myroides odoratus TaxID=256 RepID=UPI0039B082BB